MNGGTITELLAGLGGPEGGDMWKVFLQEFSPLLRQVIVFSFDDMDEQADCFVFVCEKLAANRFRRLRKFRADGTASFQTWLRAVARNLCLDWGRMAHGRAQPFLWIQRLPAADQQIFRCIYDLGYSVQQAFLHLAAGIPGITETEVEKRAAALASRISARERWLLSMRNLRIESLDETDVSGKELFEIPDLTPDPERLAMNQEAREVVASVMHKFPPVDQLLLRMRFEEDLTLQEIARLAGLKDAQAADRRLRSLLDELRRQMSGFPDGIPGKAKAASV